MKKKYVSPSISLEIVVVKKSFAALSSNPGAADWTNIDFEKWEDLFS